MDAFLSAFRLRYTTVAVGLQMLAYTRVYEIPVVEVVVARTRVEEVTAIASDVVAVERTTDCINPPAFTFSVGLNTITNARTKSETATRLCIIRFDFIIYGLRLKDFYLLTPARKG